MLRTKREYVVVSVGGSLIVPDGIDTQFLSSFRTLILKKVFILCFYRLFNVFSARNFYTVIVLSMI